MQNVGGLCKYVNINPLPTKLSHLNFLRREALSCYRDPQLQVNKN